MLFIKQNRYICIINNGGNPLPFLLRNIKINFALFVNLFLL